MSDDGPGGVSSPTTEWKLPSVRKVAMISLIIAESALFCIFLVAYAFYIGKSLNPPSPKEILEWPLLASIALLSSSGTIVFAEKALYGGRLARFHCWWLVTILLGMTFLGYTAREWYEFIYHRHFTLATNVFGSTFYSLIGLHASHVIAGLVLLLLVFAMSLVGKVRMEHHEHVEMVSWYWHFVDIAWVVVFVVVYVIGR
jgi:cytochrome c oxidase subunit III